MQFDKYYETIIFTTPTLKLPSQSNCSIAKLLNKNAHPKYMLTLESHYIPEVGGGVLVLRTLPNC